MNEKFFLGLEDNLEVESRMVECGMKPEMRFDDLSDEEKAEFFMEFDNRNNYVLERVFTMEDALEMTR